MLRWALAALSFSLALEPASAFAQAPQASPAQRYSAAVEAMRGLASPSFVTFHSDWTSTGSKFTVSQDGERIALSLGSGRGFSDHHTFAVAYRSADRTVAVDDEHAQMFIGRGRLFDPTWAGAYEIVRYGLSGTPAPQPSPSPAASADGTPAPRTIGTVMALAPAFYHVEDHGSATCPDGTNGSVLRLTAVRDPANHPLTEVTIDEQRGFFCSMRFNLDGRGAVAVTGDYELHFASSGAFWLVNGGFLDVAIRVLSISARHVTMRWDNGVLAVPTTLDPATFARPTARP